MADSDYVRLGCRADACQGEHKAHGYCLRHYRQWQRGGVREDATHCSHCKQAFITPPTSAGVIFCSNRCKVAAWKAANPERHLLHRLRHEVPKLCAYFAKHCGVCGKAGGARRDWVCCAECLREKANRARGEANRALGEAKHKAVGKVVGCDECGVEFCPLYGSSHASLCSPCGEVRKSARAKAEILDDHPHDLSTALARLEKDGLLQSHGQSRGKVYFLPGAAPVSPEQVFSAAVPVEIGSFRHTPFRSGHFDVMPGEDLDIGFSGQDTVAEAPAITRQKRDEQGCLIWDKLDAPLVDSLEALKTDLRVELETRAANPRIKRRLEGSAMDEAILAVCSGRYVRLAVLAELVGRNPDALRKRFLDRLVKTQQIRLAFPSAPNHKLQSYRATPQRLTT